MASVSLVSVWAVLAGDGSVWAAVGGGAANSCCQAQVSGDPGTASTGLALLTRPSSVLTPSPVRDIAMSEGPQSHHQ